MSKESIQQPISAEYRKHLGGVARATSMNVREKYINTAVISGMTALLGVLFDHAAFEQVRHALYEIGSSIDYMVKALIAVTGLTSLVATIKGVKHEYLYRKAKQDLKKPETNGATAIEYLATYAHRAGYPYEEKY